jgi:soluble lytic murein transglycosylase-like protein
MPRRRIPPAVFALAMSIATGAPCAVWGYIDDQGRPHLATEKLDDRYQLFFKGKTTQELAQESAPRDDALAQAEIARRIASHPNVERYEPLLARYAKQHHLDAALVKAVVAVESAFEPTAVSSKGALGLMQVLPETAQRYGVTDDARRTLEQKLFDPAINVRIGTRYLRDLLELFANDLPLALAAYNAGEATVQRYDNQVPPYPETQQFVKLVTRFYELYKPPPPPKPSRITIPRRRDAANR